MTNQGDPVAAMHQTNFVDHSQVTETSAPQACFGDKWQTWPFLSWSCTGISPRQEGEQLRPTVKGFNPQIWSYIQIAYNTVTNKTYWPKDEDA